MDWRFWRAAIIALGLCVGLISAGPALAQEFVQTRGDQFVVGGKPFFVTGVNNHYLTFGSHAEVRRVLDDAVAMGANVVRTFLQPVIGAPDGSIKTIWDWKNQVDSNDLGVHGNYLLYWDAKRHEMGINAGSNGFDRVDFLLAAARKRHLRLIIALLDFWDYAGGAQQMRAWYGSSDKNHFFFADARTRHDYRKWVRFVVDRVNPLTQVPYRDDPTIFSWELMNEPGGEPMRLRNRWVAEMSAYVKSLDANHLVSSGEALLNKAEFTTPSIDFVTWHGYPLYYGITPAQFKALIGTECALAQAHNKPVLLEEFGYARSNTNPNQPQAYRTWLDAIRSNPSCAGWVYWRLVSRQDDGQYPPDQYDQFDVHNDGSATWQVLSDAAHRGRSPP